ncbi:MAG: MoaD/ThiS family protein [Phenylobacterium sp.]|uniref:MoaD/ThiS family protein n=1 Tax=Phenylobacterium sp. TaxID=1871053 RepID=UPI00391B6E5F
MRTFEPSTPLMPAASPEASACVLFFGRVADVLGRRVEIALPAAGCSLAEVRARLGALSEDARAALSRADVRAAVDQALAGDDTWTRPGQEIAFFSMFSGG